MKQYIDKSALVAEIKNLIKRAEAERVLYPKTILSAKNYLLIEDYKKLLSKIDTLEVKEVDNFLTSFISFKDMVNIQYSSVNDGIKAHAETYSFNIESELFNQLTPEQQKLWRKEIEQACISGGEMGVELARDTRYKENLKVKEVDLEKELSYEDYIRFFEEHPNFSDDWGFDEAWVFAKHFFELGLKAQKGK